MTVPTDKLIAIAGVAELVQTRSKSSYIVSLWSSVRPEFGLLWRVKGTCGEKQMQYCAPSWSWASVEGRIEILPKVDFAHVHLKEGRIGFKARVEQVNVMYQGQRVTDTRSLVDSAFLDITGQVAEVYSCDSRSRSVILVDSRRRTRTKLNFFPDWVLFAQSPIDQLLALRVMTVRGPSTVTTFGMVLMLKTGEELPVKYERVGLFSVLHNENCDIESRFEGWNQQTIRII